jgi:hypothetical protein
MFITPEGVESAQTFLDQLMVAVRSPDGQTAVDLALKIHADVQSIKNDIRIDRQRSLAIYRLLDATLLQMNTSRGFEYESNLNHFVELHTSLEASQANVTRVVAAQLNMYMGHLNTTIALAAAGPVQACFCHTANHCFIRNEGGFEIESLVAGATLVTQELTLVANANNTVWFTAQSSACNAGATIPAQYMDGSYRFNPGADFIVLSLVKRANSAGSPVCAMQSLLTIPQSRSLKLCYGTDANTHQVGVLTIPSNGDLGFLG